MTDAIEDEANADRPEQYAFALPTVSVVIVNYNYGQYLQAAVESVFNQTYSQIECILLDNASTDDSHAVIESLSVRFPAMLAVKRATNDGQAVASVEGFLSTKGPYVTFLDADDVMLPDFLATHMFVHLSLRVPIGFSCSDMFQTLGKGLVLGAFVPFSDYVRSREGQRADLVRGVDQTEHALPLGCLKPVPETSVHFVEATRKDWPWASMSAFVFRRDALNLVMHNPALTTLFSNFDVYVARGVNVLTGSVIIDRALTVYRMHDSNVFARHPQLNGWANFERGGKFDEEKIARRLLIDYLLDRSAERLKKVQSEWRYVDALITLNAVKPALRTQDGRHSYLSSRLVAESPALRKHLGLGRVFVWAARMRVSPIAFLMSVLRA